MLSSKYLMRKARKNASIGASRRVIRRYCVSASGKDISFCKDYKLFKFIWRLEVYFWY